MGRPASRRRIPARMTIRCAIAVKRGRTQTAPDRRGGTRSRGLLLSLNVMLLVGAAQDRVRGEAVSSQHRWQETLTSCPETLTSCAAWGPRSGEPGSLGTSAPYLAAPPARSCMGGGPGSRPQRRPSHAGSGPLTLPVRSVDTVSCHGVPKTGMTGWPWRRVWRVYRWFAAANRPLAGGLHGVPGTDNPPAGPHHRVEGPVLGDRVADDHAVAADL